MKLIRIQPGEYENEDWYVIRQAEEDGPELNTRGMAIHPMTGHEYTPAPEFSWFVYNKDTGDLYDAFPTLREARNVAER